MAQRQARHDPAPLGSGAEAARRRAQATARRSPTSTRRRFRSDGFTRFFAMLKAELADDYMQTVERQLRELEFKRGVLESAAARQGQQGPPLRRAQDARAALDRPAPVRQAARRATASRSRPATRTASGPWRRSAAGESTTSPTRSRSRPITSRASSACSGSSSPSTSAASTCTSGSMRRASRPASPRRCAADELRARRRGHLRRLPDPARSRTGSSATT